MGRRSCVAHGRAILSGRSRCHHVSVPAQGSSMPFGSASPREPARRPGSTPAPRGGVTRQAHSAPHARTVWPTFRAGDSYRWRRSRLGNNAAVATAACLPVIAVLVVEPPVWSPLADTEHTWIRRLICFSTRDARSLQVGG